MISQIIYRFDFSSVLVSLGHYKEVFIVMSIGYMLHWMPDKWKENLQEIFAATNLVTKILIAFFLIVLIYQALSSDMQPFIYFQF